MTNKCFKPGLNRNSSCNLEESVKGIRPQTVMEKLVDYSLLLVNQQKLNHNSILTIK